MKLGHCEAWHFGSYEHIQFDMSSTGLSLVYGKTGSGKSMLADLPCWILFGITSKNGAADDVRAWQTPDQPTKGILDVQLSEGSITVTRIRGRAGQNDLYWTESESPDKKERGKDLTETQKRLSSRLGVDSTLYLCAAYFCDFSPSGQFFVSKASDRRALFEKIAKLDLPIKIAERTSEARKLEKKKLEKAEVDHAKVAGRLEQLTESYADVLSMHGDWAGKCASIEAELKAKFNVVSKEANKIPALEAKMTFIQEELNDVLAFEGQLTEAQVELQRGQIERKYKSDALAQLKAVGNDACPTCLSPQAGNTAKEARIEELMGQVKRSRHDIEGIKDKIRRIEGVLDRRPSLEQDLRKVKKDRDDRQAALEMARKELAGLNTDNPFDSQVHNLEVSKVDATKQVEKVEAIVAASHTRIASLSVLYDLSLSLRSELLHKAVKTIETSTNDYLDRYFDAEIRVYFSATDSDNLDVTIQKSGFECSYKQLSKGQRQLLKLCFSVSIMEAAANAAGVHFDNLYFDEALDGMDDELKVKSFSLFTELSTAHSSIIMIDHAPAFQSLFDNKYHVTMESDHSLIEERHG